MAEERDWQRLQRAVLAWRGQRRLSQSQVAARGGFSVATLRKIENGTWQPRDPWQVLAGLDAALRWEARSAERILLDGRDPIVIPDPPDPHLARLLPAWPGLDSSARKLVADLVELQEK